MYRVVPKPFWVLPETFRVVPKTVGNTHENSLDVAGRCRDVPKTFWDDYERFWDAPGSGLDFTKKR